MFIETMEHLIKGAYDLHLQIAPDLMERKLDDVEMAQRAIQAGMAGFAPRSHYYPTIERCQNINHVFNGEGSSSTKIHSVGSLVLNQSVGGINPTVVEIFARSGGKIVWFPTQDSRHARADLKSGKPIEKLPHWARIVLDMEANGIAAEEIYILDDQGNLKPEVLKVLEIIKYHDLVLFTGNLSHEETFVLVKQAYQMGIQKIVIALVDHPSVNYSIQEQEQLAKYGAYMEHCYNTYASGKCDQEEAIKQIRAIGPDRVIISSDLGQPNGIYPDQGMLAYAILLKDSGFNEEEIYQMMGGNAKKLLDI